MKNLEQNIEYQILTLRVKVLENNEIRRKFILKNGYCLELLKLEKINRPLYEKLKNIEQELKAKYNALELTSDNLQELENITKLLFYFKTIDESLLSKIQSKISELRTIKEKYLEQWDFKMANVAREEARQLQKYYNSNKNYLKK